MIPLQTPRERRLYRALGLVALLCAGLVLLHVLRLALGINAWWGLMACAWSLCAAVVARRGLRRAAAERAWRATTWSTRTDA